MKLVFLSIIMIGLSLNLYANCDKTEQKSITKSFYTIFNDFNLINDNFIALKNSISNKERNGTLCEDFKELEKELEIFENFNLNIQFTKKVIEGEWKSIYQDCQKESSEFYDSIKKKLKYLKTISKSSERINNKVKENIQKIEKKCIIDTMRQEIYGTNDTVNGIPVSSMPLY